VPLPSRAAVRLLARAALLACGLALLLPPAGAQAAGSTGTLLPSDPVVRLLAAAAACGVVLALLGLTGLWLTRRRR